MHSINWRLALARLARWAVVALGGVALAGACLAQTREVTPAAAVAPPRTATVPPGSALDKLQRQVADLQLRLRAAEAKAQNLEKQIAATTTPTPGQNPNRDLQRRLDLLAAQLKQANDNAAAAGERFEEELKAKDTKIQETRVELDKVRDELQQARTAVGAATGRATQETVRLRRENERLTDAVRRADEESSRLRSEVNFLERQRGAAARIAEKDRWLWVAAAAALALALGTFAGRKLFAPKAKLVEVPMSAKVSLGGWSMAAPLPGDGLPAFSVRTQLLPTRSRLEHSGPLVIPEPSH